MRTLLNVFSVQPRRSVGYVRECQLNGWRRYTQYILDILDQNNGHQKRVQTVFKSVSKQYFPK